MQISSTLQRLLGDVLLCLEHGGRKRRIKLMLDREYETSSTGDDSAPEPQRGRPAPSTLNNHSNVNGGLYVAQNGSIIRTRRTAAPNSKPPSPVFSSQLAKHFKKLDKMAATLEEKIPLSGARTVPQGGAQTLRTFKSPPTPSFSNFDIHKTVNVFDTRQSSVSSEVDVDAHEQPPDSDSGTNGVLLHTGTTEDGDGLGQGERESSVDAGNSDAEEGLVMRDLPQCAGERTQEEQGELWMGTWNNVHIPMTKL